MPYFEVLNGPEVGKRVPLDQDTFFVGRDANNHLVLSDRTVSRKHAVINWVDSKPIVSDLKSLKGILVNGSKVNEATLQEGDEIAFGAVRVRFYLSGAGEANPLPGTRKNSKPWVLLGGIFSVLVLLGGIFYTLGFHLPRQTAFPNLETIRAHYERGVALFNAERNLEQARGEWQKVLELDPDKTTSFGQKAAKLLENTSEK